MDDPYFPAQAQQVSSMAGQTGVAFCNGNGTSATFDGPHGLACDASGNIYVC